MSYSFGKASPVPGVLLVLLALALASTGVSAQTTRPDHVVIVIEENQSARKVFSDLHMPYIHWLAEHGAKMTNAFFGEIPYGVTPKGSQQPLRAQPSQPNYLYVFSGNNQGVLPASFRDPNSPYLSTESHKVWRDTNGDDLVNGQVGVPRGIANDLVPAGMRPFTTPNLGAAIMRAGGSFMSFSESLPFPHYDEAADPDPHANFYRRKHNPVINWINLPGRSIPTSPPQFLLPVAANLGFMNTYDPVDGKKYRGFAVDENGNALDYKHLPTVSLVIPNAMHSAHSASRAASDRWLSENIKGYADWAMTHNSLLIITYDEDGLDSQVPENIPTIFYGPMIRPGAYEVRVDHLNVLATVLDLYGALEQFKNAFRAAHGSFLGASAEVQNELENLRPIREIFVP
jgi:hypothetical protein